ncbi:Sugar efflux transporter for intercellular exchange [Phytophthora infestans]|nr:Sugar efflux transporter for intercellular exchange [Phytophthora infestans]
MLASIAFGGIYYHWTRDHAHIHKLYGAAFYLLAGYTLYYSLGTSGATNQSNEAVANTLGAVSGLINLALYASPLERIQNVVETKDASTFPITLSALFLVNGVIWVLYCIAQDDMLHVVLVPNALGVVLCVVQVGLYVVYKFCNSSTDIQLVDESYTLRETLTNPETQEYSRTAVSLENIN